MLIRHRRSGSRVRDNRGHPKDLAGESSWGRKVTRRGIERTILIVLLKTNHERAKLNLGKPVHLSRQGMRGILTEHGLYIPEAVSVILSAETG